jgi:hypothetical protein
MMVDVIKCRSGLGVPGWLAYAVASFLGPGRGWRALFAVLVEFWCWVVDGFRW